MAEYSTLEITNAPSATVKKDVLYSEVTETGIRKATDSINKTRLQEYSAYSKTGEGSYLGNSYSSANPIKEDVDELFNILNQIIASIDNPILTGNLIASFHTQLESLWNLRECREREFAKIVVLFQSVTKNNDSELVKPEILNVLIEMFQIFKRPKISELDISTCRKKIRNAGLDIAKPLTIKPKFKIILQEEP